LLTEPLLGSKKLHSNAVYLAGLETVKGFEFSRVFIIGVGEGFPAPYLPPEEAWRDVRRLYVAMTRARDEVVLSYAGRKSTCLDGLEEFLSETTSSAERPEREQQPKEIDEVVWSAPPTLHSQLHETKLRRSDAPSLDGEFSSSTDLRHLFKAENLEIHDKRDRGGCFWVVGGAELQPLMEMLRKRGITFSYTANGSRTTGRRPAWYLK
jgi:hypothetical protein